MTLDEAFTKLPTFETSRMVIRPLDFSDADGIFEIQSDPKVREMYGREPYSTLDQTRGWIEGRVAGYRNRESMFWVYSLKDEPRVIGSCCFWHFEEESLCAELGYELNRMYWGRGYTSEALAPVLNFAFNRAGLNRIEACPLAENGPSNRVLQKLGFKFEGTLRERVQFRARFIDLNYYSLLRGELQPTPSDGP